MGSVNFPIKAGDGNVSLIYADDLADEQGGQYSSDSDAVESRVIDQAEQGAGGDHGDVEDILHLGEFYAENVGDGFYDSVRRRQDEIRFDTQEDSYGGDEGGQEE